MYKMLQINIIILIICSAIIALPITRFSKAEYKMQQELLELIKPNVAYNRLYNKLLDSDLDPFNVSVAMLYSDVPHDIAKLVFNELTKHFPSFLNKYNNTIYNDNNPLTKAILLGEADVVKKLLSIKPSLIKLLDKNGNTVLHIAATSGGRKNMAEICGILLSADSNLNHIKNKEGLTAIALLKSQGLSVRGNINPQDILSILKKYNSYQ